MDVRLYGLILLAVVLPMAAAQSLDVETEDAVVGKQVCAASVCVGDGAGSGTHDTDPGPSTSAEDDGAAAQDDAATAEDDGAAQAPRAAAGPAPAGADDRAHEFGSQTLWAVVAASAAGAAAAIAAQTGWIVRAAAWVARGAFAVFLFSRIRPDRLAKHPVRAQMLDLVRAEPGIPLQEVQRRVEVAWGTAVYHLNRLEKERILVSHRTGNKRLFFVANTPVAKLRQGYGLVQTGTSRRIAKTVLDQPGLDQKSVCRMLSIGNPTASKHLGRLEKEGLVQSEKVSRQRFYRPTPALQAILSVQAA